MATTINQATALTTARTRPIYWWASLGFLFLLLDVYVIGAWMTSDKFVYNEPGPSSAAGFVHFWVYFWQIVSVLIGVGVLTYIVTAWRRHNRVPTLAVFMIAWQICIWQDPLINFIRPMFTYSSMFFNMGSWSEFIPGWISPNGSRMPEPLFFQAGMYIFGIPMGCMCAVGAMRFAHRKIPNITKPQLVMVAILAGIAFDMFLEFWWLRMQLYSYLGTIHEGTLFDGELWQFPIYNFVIWGSVLGVSGSFYYFKDDRGNMVCEKGSETIRNKTGQTLLRILAIAGLLNVVYLVYSVILIMTTLYIDPWASGLPSWMVNEVCGAGTSYECPGPDVHVPLPNSGPIEPFTGRN